MGFFKEEKAFGRIAQLVIIPRWMKTIFFIVTMITSLLLFSAPLLLLVITDWLLPSALLNATLLPGKFSSLIDNYDFRYSLVDIPIISIIRSIIILCVYSFSDRRRRPYLVVASALTAASLLFVSLKALYMFVIHGGGEKWSGGYNRVMELCLFASSVGLGIGHVVLAYRTSRKERRKLMVYKIDIEAVYACHKGFLDAKKHSRKLEVIKE